MPYFITLPQLNICGLIKENDTYVLQFSLLFLKSKTKIEKLYFKLLLYMDM
jgi:hypothetical protein